MRILRKFLVIPMTGHPCKENSNNEKCPKGSINRILSVILKFLPVILKGEPYGRSLGSLREAYKDTFVKKGIAPGKRLNDSTSVGRVNGSR